MAPAQPYTVANCLTQRMHKGINTTLDEGQTPVLAQPYTLAIRGRGDSHNLEYRQDGTANALLTPNGGRGGIGVGAIAHAFDARQSNVIQYGDKTGPLDTDGHSFGVAIPIDTMNHLGRGDSHSFGDFQPGAPSYTLTKGHSHAVAVAVRTANTSANGHGISAELAHTLDQAQGQAVAIGFDAYNNAITGDVAKTLDVGQDHHHVPLAAVLAPTLTATNDPSRSPQSSEITAQVAAVVQATAFTQNQRNEVRTLDIAGALAAEPGMKQQTYLQAAMQVRRLTPVECERLQGFPDNYTAIPWRGKPASECPDGPRYKALGNSWAVPVVRWIGARIAAQTA